MKEQYIVQCKDKKERKYLYTFLINNDYILIHNFTYQRVLNSAFPFVIEPNNTFWICESITCCAAAYANNGIISFNEFINLYQLMTRTQL